VILVFVGLKIFVSHHYKLPVEWTLGIVFGLLLVAAVASVVFAEKKTET
jgi:predicted tellurium resistance membrane protein TerC